MASPVRTCHLSVMHSRGLGAGLAMKAPGDELGAGVGLGWPTSCWFSLANPKAAPTTITTITRAVARRRANPVGAPMRSTRIPLRNRAIESPSLPGDAAGIVARIERKGDGAGAAPG